MSQQFVLSNKKHSSLDRRGSPSNGMRATITALNGGISLRWWEISFPSLLFFIVRVFSAIRLLMRVFTCLKYFILLARKVYFVY